MKDLNDSELKDIDGGLIFIPAALGYLCGVVIGTGTVVGIVELGKRLKS